MPARWKDSGALRALREITRIGARLHHVLSRRTGLGPTDLTALELLSIEMMGPAELARHLDITTAAATGVVDRLEARGHVVRRPIPGDRRRTGVHITDAGRREAWLHLTPMFAALQANDAQFTEEERAVVERYLTGAANAINTVVEGDPRDLVDGAG
ncbi:MarR family transcriptional regulator [Nocardioides jishulii]|uniref:MarR family transcriptional regulator n=1 Tax=Nocardioides jishulii TaxID=2575440 RepID=A0A4U2YRL5_9ACTN|nr:MarR family transcriptional regulator [Nocardioides jishulii]QCX26142.1 MarR family transcriptional regulator [Nocardioides jishulii]TKI64059.1 MarR family transcriptional regulator [Nocardioides jishulii]